MIGYMFKAMYYLATSKVCVTESYCVPISILTHKKELKIIFESNPSINLEDAVESCILKVIDKIVAFERDNGIQLETNEKR